MALDAAFGEKIAKDGAKVGVFFFAATDPVIRVWAGFGDCKGGINTIDGSDHIYSGMGELKQIPDLEALINGQAARVVFTLSGISTAGMELADSDPDSFKRKLVSIGLATFDSDWQKDSDIFWLWWGYGDTVLINISQGDTPGQFINTVGLSVGSIFTSRRRPQYSHLTDAEQQALHPGDKFCDRVAMYSNQTPKSWPRY